MAKEYIERDAALKEQKTFTEYDEGGWDAAVRAVPVDAIKKIPAADVVEVKWIPVTERLPENEQDVLITVRRKHYCKPGEYIRFVVKAFYTDGKHDTEHSVYTWFDDMEYDEENDAYKIPEGWWESIEYGEEFQAVGDFVTHWMPLLKPPEEDDND